VWRLGGKADNGADEAAKIELSRNLIPFLVAVIQSEVSRFSLKQSSFTASFRSVPMLGKIQRN
jgi:hypothetical protein